MNDFELKDWTSQRETISEKYTQFLQKHGISYKALNWGSEYSTQLRYKILAEIANLEHQSILDVGCGLGGLYQYLNMNLQAFEYEGVDITPNMISECKKLYPNTKFSIFDILIEPKPNQYDYVMASGIFTYLGQAPEQKFFAIIEKLYALAKKGVAFNILLKVDQNATEDEFTVNPAAIINPLLNMCPKLSFRNDYLPHDLTIYMYK